MAAFNGSNGYLSYTQTYPLLTRWSMGAWIYADANPQQYSSIWQSRSDGFIGFTTPGGNVGNRVDVQMDWDGTLYTGPGVGAGAGILSNRWAFIAGTVDVAAGVVQTYAWASGGLLNATNSGLTLTARAPSAWFVGVDGGFIAGSRNWGAGAICHLIAEPAVWTPAQIIAMGEGTHPLDVVRAPAFYRALTSARTEAGDLGNGALVPTSVGVRGGAPVLPRRRLRPPVIEADAIAGGGTVTGDGSAAGVGAAVGVGAATAAATAAATGTGTALGVGSFTLAATQGVGNAAGTGTAAGVGAATVAATANAAGLGQALGIGAAIGIVAAVGNAAGTSTALGYSPQLLGGGEAGRGAKGGRRRKRITWLPADYDIETGEPRGPIAAEPAPIQPPSVQLTKGERKVARLLAQYRGRDDDVAERARAQLEALRAAEDGALARFIARQQALDVQRRAAAATAAEDDDAVVAFMRWMMSNP